MRRSFVSGEKQVHLFVREGNPMALRIEVDNTKGTTFSRVAADGELYPEGQGWAEVAADRVPLPDNLIIERVIDQFHAE